MKKLIIILAIAACARFAQAQTYDSNGNYIGYGNQWSDFARMYKRQHPVCNRCGYATQVVHHIVPLDEGGEQFDEGNLEALCRECHERHHGRMRWK